MDQAQKRQKREDGAEILEAAMARMESTTMVAGFIPSNTFTGARPGYVFKKGLSGVGFYPDKIEQDKIAKQQPTQQKKKAAAPLDANKLLEEAEREHAAEADAQVEVLDVRGLKRLILSFEKKLRDNMEARMKYAENPDKFLESEIDLDDEIKKLHALATAPKLYPELVRLNAHASILNLLSHENPDIAVDTVEVLHELTSSDVMEDCEEEAQILVDALLESNTLELLVQNLSRFDEKIPEEASAVFNSLGVIENMMEVRKEIAEAALTRTKLLRWLLSRIKPREFDSNKFYAAELLSILMQGNEPNQKKLGAANGIDTLLQAAAMYKGREPHTSDEEEMVANLFDAMCWVVMHSENKEKFVQAEGIELMLLIMKNKRFARLSALKTLDFALTRCPAGCERFVDVLGLKSAFAAFMGKVHKTTKRKLTPEEKEEEEQRAISLVASLFLGLSRGSRRDRLGSKFVEAEFEKIDRLMEMFIKFKAQVDKATKEYMQECQEEGLDADDEELFTARSDAGLFTLQMVVLIMANVWSFSHAGMKARVLLLLTQHDLQLSAARELLQEHCDTIGESDGAEERQKRQKRIQK
eukprot:CAMPEP_0198198424 /NCGR_PEP_ID=MMETSP1445-20131203/1901_1 /TAXON_ID=36898 /ORGANISM="Pyramimonas sp., Strain CCMP2087" /LENGTH=584 /DNA_ID=CAMNT_0043867989 /DNA_START=217 /DNA_END=1968 /DNA_ORIENTATION=+